MQVSEGNGLAGPHDKGYADFHHVVWGISQDDPNRIAFMLSPTGSNGAIFRAELISAQRHVERPSADSFVDPSQLEAIT